MAQLKSALSDARSEAETCLAVLTDSAAEGGAPGPAGDAELRKQLQEARDAAESYLMRMGSAAPTDEVCSECSFRAATSPRSELLGRQALSRLAAASVLITSCVPCRCGRAP